LTTYLDLEKLEETSEPQSWRFDPAHLVALIDLLLASSRKHNVDLLVAYYQRILDGQWPEEGRNEPYHPGPKWAAPFVQGLQDWKFRTKLSDEQKRKMKRLNLRVKAVESDLTRQIMEAYFQAKRQLGGDIPFREPGSWEKRVAEYYRTP
jgi:hypothetical protein